MSPIAEAPPPLQSTQPVHSFSQLDHSKAQKGLSSLINECNIHLGGSSVGKGLKKAAKFYLQQRRAKGSKPSHFDLPGAADLNPEWADLTPPEDSFYVIDIGVLVSQVYQWRKYFPRVEPFYAVKCNPDPVIVKTLALLGCNFDCASRGEIRLVEECSKDLPHGRKPEIIYANPCKARAHLMEAVCRGVRMVTFDNATEVMKCAAISKKIQLIMRIITDDRGSQCRLSTKFGAPRQKWRPLLQAAKQHGLQVVGVSFHVGSGCRDSSRYEMAIKDAREIFDMAEKDFGMKMHILDIGGGFPGETHSMWNPAAEDPEEIEEEEDDHKEGLEEKSEEDNENRFMFFTEIAEQVSPVIDQYFPADSGVRVIGEPGRYFAAACATLCCSVVSTRSNEIDASFQPEPIDDAQASEQLHLMTREEEEERVRGQRGQSLGRAETDDILLTIQEELADYSKLYATQQLAQQEVDVYNDSIDIYKEDFESAADLLGPPDEDQRHRRVHTVEGMTYPLVINEGQDEDDCCGVTSMLTLAAAGEAAVNGMVLQAVADSAPLQDDFAYYINDGVYGAFNNIMFDHSTVRPRVLHMTVPGRQNSDVELETFGEKHYSSDDENVRELYASTVFGPTCDSIDVIARSVLLPKLKVGDWMYFQNMGAYTMAAASAFNGFIQSEKFYVCSINPDYFEGLIKGPEAESAAAEEKKED